MPFLFIKTKRACAFSATLQMRYTLGYWHNNADGRKNPGLRHKRPSAISATALLRLTAFAERTQYAQTNVPLTPN